VSGAGLYLLRQTYAPIRTEAVRQAMREIEGDLSFGGVNAVEQAFFPDAAQWLGSDRGNLILMDAAGQVFASLNDNFLQGQARLNLLTPRYHSGRSGRWSWGECGPAVILNEAGEILYRLSFLPDTAHHDEGDRSTAFGLDSPPYDAYFPPLNQALYRAYASYLENGVVYDDWEGEAPPDPDAVLSPETPGEGIRYEAWMEPPSVQRALLLGATQADVDAVKRYCAWEQEQLKQAGDLCAQLVADETKERFALAIYENNDQTNAAYNRTMRLWSWFANLLPVWIVGLMLLIVMMAFWVLRDARKRDFKPMLWGVLTLLGNVVTLIVYLIVRPTPARCPACGAGTHREYIACPMCGHALRAMCPSCGRAQESAWVCCPYCGRNRSEERRPKP
jgi:hypothetical protein